MNLLYKAMTRPSMFMGVPIAPFSITVGFLFLFGVYFTKLIWLFIPIAIYVLGLISKKDDQIFNLYFLRLLLNGNARSNKYNKAITFNGSTYENIEVDEMNLNDREVLSRHIPYSSHVAENIIRTKESDYICTLKVLGINFESISPEELELVDRQFETLIRSMSNQPVAFYSHVIRDELFDEFETKSGNEYADIISNLYYENIKNKKFKTSEIYFSVIYRPVGKMDKLNKPKTKNESNFRIEKHVREFEEIISMISSSLDKFTCQKLGMYEENDRLFSSQLSFYYYLISGIKQKIRVTKTPFYETLSAVDLYFKNNIGQAVTATKNNRFFKSIEIKDFSDETISGMFDVLHYSKYNFVLTQSYSSLGKTEALQKINGVIKKMISTEDDAQTQLEELTIAKDQIVSGKISFGNYHYTLMIYAETIDELNKHVSMAISDLTELGLVTSVASLSLVAGYLSQMPAQFKYRPRLSAISSINFANMAGFHNHFQGKRDLNCWGEAVTILKTPSNSPYYLNFHSGQMFKNEIGEKNLGHTLILGGSGSGKTMFLSFIANMLQKYNNPVTFNDNADHKKLTTIFLDKDRGAELNYRMLGGEYYKIKAGEITGWNPFSLSNKDEQNIQFIKQLMEIICTMNGEKLSVREEIIISEAVDSIMAFEDGDYMRENGISGVLEHLMTNNDKEAQENGLIIRLQRWAKGGEYGWIFDNEIDNFNIDNIANFGIDGTEFLDNEKIRAPITSYILYRITRLCDGRRVVLILDEFWKWLSDETFSDFVYDKLKTIRKLNGIVICATQSPAEILKNDIARAVIEQCSTKIYLANLDAEYNDYVKGFNVTEHEFEIIKNIDPLSRRFLIKKSSIRQGDSRSFSALAMLDLSGIAKSGLLKVMSASSDNLTIFDAIYEDGMKPSEWIPKFLEKSI